MLCNGLATPGKRGKKPLKIATPLDKGLVYEATLNSVNCQKSYSEIAVIIRLQASEKTLWTALAKQGYNRRIVRKKPYQDSTRCMKCLQFRLHTQTLSKAIWRMVLSLMNIMSG